MLLWIYVSYATIMRGHKESIFSNACWFDLLFAIAVVHQSLPTKWQLLKVGIKDCVGWGLGGFHPIPAGIILTNPQKNRLKFFQYVTHGASNFLNSPLSLPNSHHH
jgi:hypothetical protein